MTLKVKKIIAVLCVLSLVAGVKGLVKNVSAADSKSEIYSYIETALLNEKEVINISQFQVSIDEAVNIYNGIIENSIELMNVDTGVSYEYEINEKGQTICSKLTPSYISVGNLEERRQKVKAAVNYIISKLDNNMTDVEKALAVHDYLVLNIEYAPIDEGIFEKSYYTVYGALVEHKAVCQGYARAYAYILNKIGIETIFVSSKDMDHMWNMVKIDGKYYHVDATYDDPTLSNDYPSDRLGRVSHQHFLVGDSTMQNELNHYNWEGPVASEDYSNLKMWSGIDSPMQYLNGKWYYASYDRDANYATNIYEYDLKNDRQRRIASFDYMLWPDKKTGEYFDGSYMSIAIVNNHIYYNTPTEIRILNTSTGKSDTVLKVDQKAGNIYGIVLQDGKLIYGVGNNPNVPCKIESSGITEKADTDVTTTPEEQTTKEHIETKVPQTEVTETKVTNEVHISVKNTKIKKVKKYKAKKKIKITISKLFGVSGYQVQYATNKRFKKAKIKTFKKTKYTIQKLKKKKYYIRVRGYVTDKKKKIYGNWSKYKVIKMK